MLNFCISKKYPAKIVERREEGKHEKSAGLQGFLLII